MAGCKKGGRRICLKRNWLGDTHRATDASPAFSRTTYSDFAQMGLQIIIVGGGIAGLASACALRGEHDVTVSGSGSDWGFHIVTHFTPHTDSRTDAVQDRDRCGNSVSSRRAKKQEGPL